MGIIDGIFKGLTSAVLAALAAWYGTSASGTPDFLCIPATVTAGLAGFVIYARGWIQGYFVDQWCNSKKSLKGRTVVITGGTYGGLGYAAAELLAERGARIILTCRSTSKAEQAIEMLKRTYRLVQVDCVLVDFMSAKSVRDAAAKIISLTDRLDFVVLNAGIASGGAGGDPAVWMTNYLGPFLFTEDLRPLLTKTAAAADGEVRVVSVSSGAHKAASIHWQDPFNPVAQVCDCMTLSTP